MPDQARIGADQEDLARGAAGDRGALDRLFGRHEAALRRLARVLTQDEAAAEDVLQDALLAATQHAGSFRGEGSVRAWLLSIVRRAASRGRRRRAGEPTRWVELDDQTPLHVLGEAAGWGSPLTPEALLSAQERRRGLMALIERLAPAEQVVIHLRDLEGLSYEEVSVALEEPLSAVKTRLHRARLRLLALARAEEGGEHG
jgi:RNA polymerase sigma-70 factor (ECF subfamily)